MKRVAYLLLIAVILLIAGCKGKETRQKVLKDTADSLTSVLYDMMGGDPDRALDYVDSLEAAGVYSEALANCRRAQVYSELYLPRVSEVYALKALKDEKLKQDTNLYFFAYNLLINSVQNVDNTEKALKYATEALEQAKGDTIQLMRAYAADFMSSIASSQFRLNYHREGNESYERAYQMYEDVLVGKKKFSWIYPEFLMATDALNDNVAIDSLAIAKKWVARMLAIFDKTVACTDIPTYVKDDCLAQKEIALAKYYASCKQLHEAHVHYQKFLQTDMSKTEIGSKVASSYLETTGRWQELEAAVERTDSFFIRNESQSNIDYLITVLGRKYDVQERLGHHAAAVKTARQLITLLDTVREQSLKDNAAELAVIYKTQEKDQQIAEQQADLSHQRLIAVLVAFVLVVVFFVIYTIKRRQAAKRLAAVSAQKERIESELRIARDIQMSMVPSDFPQYEGLDIYAQMVPAREVGGDLYDCLLQDNRLYFCVGDVSGKGVPASLFMAQTMRLFRAFAKRSYQPDKIATRINDELTENNENGMFVTMFIGLLDLTTGRLDFCNCGHNPPVIASANVSESVEFLHVEPNAPIGLWPGLEFVGETIDSVKGQPLLVYTDGLNEAEDSQQQQFGDARLLQVLTAQPFESARQTIALLSTEIEKHRAGAEPNDDLTMLCLKLR